MPHKIKLGVQNEKYSKKQSEGAYNSNMCLTRKALPYSGATLYNQLPSQMRKASTFKSFKTMAYKYVMCYVFIFYPVFIVNYSVLIYLVTNHCTFILPPPITQEGPM